MVVALIALFVALGGAAMALPGRNSVDSGDIKNNGVKSGDIKNDGVTGSDVNEATLGTVPKATSADSAASAPDPTFNGGPLRSGQVMRGIWNLYQADDGSGNAELFGEFPFPVPTGVPLFANIGIGTKDNSGTGSVAGLVADNREDPGCTGTFLEPSAPAGKLCIYVRSDVVVNIAANGVVSYPTTATEGGLAGELGFAMTATEGAATGASRVEGSWAFTAA